MNTVLESTRSGTIPGRPSTNVREHSQATADQLEAPLTVGLVGCGKMGLQHVRAIGACHGGRLIAAADPGGDPEKLRGLLPDGVQWFGSAREMLETARPQVVHIATPPATHADLAKLCLENGAHVYVEKPFTLTATDAAGVLDVAGRAGRSVCAGHQLLMEGPARSLLASLPMIGRVVHLESYFAFRSVRKSRDGRSLMSPIDQLLDILPHPVYTMLEALRACEPNAVPAIVSLDVRAEGEVHALLRAGDATGVLVVTLRGRPIESYLRVVGTNGCLRADFVRGALTRLPGPGTSALSVVSNPYREATQIVRGSTSGFAHRLRGRKKGYPGLAELIEAFYESIRKGGPSPLSPASILDTVTICERVGEALRAREEEREQAAIADLNARERELPAIDPAKGVVLVTGGSGLLGRAVVQDLRRHGFAVRAVSRRVAPPSAREAGIEYGAADLGAALAPELFRGVSTVVHCAAETAGDKQAHDRNTVTATRNLLQAAAAAGIRRFVHISSIAVLKPSSVVGGPLTEQTPVDLGNLARGPYVWAKAQAERDVIEIGADARHESVRAAPRTARRLRGIRTTRAVSAATWARFSLPLDLAPGASVSAPCRPRRRSFAAPLRIWTACRRWSTWWSPTPRRERALALFLSNRPDLRAFWMPAWVLAVLSPMARMAQRILMPRSTPVDLAAAFSSERYDTTVAEGVVRRAQSTT